MAILALAEENRIPIPFEFRNDNCGSCLIEVSHDAPERK
ncbi:2Fe-2S iron-sulfur cluster binding domain-containing protein, partial [Rhodovulum sp.]